MKLPHIEHASLPMAFQATLWLSLIVYLVNLRQFARLHPFCTMEIATVAPVFIYVNPITQYYTMAIHNLVNAKVYAQT